MAELGIDITTATRKVLTGDAVQTTDVMITTGCGDACPYFPGVSYRDWTCRREHAHRRRDRDDVLLCHPGQGVGHRARRERWEIYTALADSETFGTAPEASSTTA
jgi:hypothetical protein